jgi:hypothetical protein
MKIKPINLRVANAYIDAHHRHHKSVVGHRFSLQCVNDNDEVLGVVIVGRPVCRNSGDQLEVCEVTRLCTDGQPNVCSKLYGAAARVAKEMGFKKIQTYILSDEPGTSLKASGWKFVASTQGGLWNHSDGKPRRRDQPADTKSRWEKLLNE